MADAVSIDFESGMTAELYDQVNARVNPPDGSPPGLLFHCAGPSPGGGWRVIDVWDSHETFQRFMESKVLPAVAELVGAEGMEQVKPPTITSWPLHNLELHG